MTSYHNRVPRLRPVSRPVDVNDAERFPNIAAAIEELTADVERFARLQAEWGQ